jgi:vancomycin resistance protein YoaR
VGIFTQPPQEVEVASFGTSVVGRTPEQLHNIVLATRAVNGTVLQPGAVFSFAAAVGDLSRPRGYIRALAIRNRQLTPVVGGGVCQVSSTLYNAALRADLGIVERSRHIWPVESVPPGLDAAFAVHQFDLKFKNTHGAPLRIVGSVEAGRLTFRLLSRRPGDRQVEVLRQVEAVREPAEIVQPDPRRPIGSRVVVNRGQRGYEVQVYRIVSRQGVELRRELISDDHYAPMDRIVRVGMGRLKGAKR